MLLYTVVLTRFTNVFSHARGRSDRVPDRSSACTCSYGSIGCSSSLQTTHAVAGRIIAMLVQPTSIVTPRGLILRHASPIDACERPQLQDRGVACTEERARIAGFIARSWQTSGTHIKPGSSLAATGACQHRRIWAQKSASAGASRLKLLCKDMYRQHVVSNSGCTVDRRQRRYSVPWWCHRGSAVLLRTTRSPRTCEHTKVQHIHYRLHMPSLAAIGALLMMNPKCLSTWGCHLLTQHVTRRLWPGRRPAAGPSVN
jgi:hypothetical protein